MSKSPSVVVFDVNETLSDMGPLAARFAAVGAPEHLAKLWFATLLRDGFALTAAGTCKPFSVLSTEALNIVLHGVPLNRDVKSAVDHILDGFLNLRLHPDVPDAVRSLRASGLRLVTLSNGSTQIAEQLFAAAGIRQEFEALLTVEDAGVWKPAPDSYAHAARICRTELADMLLVAAHPWDIDGASRAGMSTAWVNRTGGPYPGYFTPPRHVVATLAALPAELNR